MPTGVRETISGSRCGARVVVQRAVSGATRPPEEIFDEHPDGLAIYRWATDVIDGLGEAGVRVSKSQIAFRVRRGFAYVWRPGRYVDNDVPRRAVDPVTRRGQIQDFKPVVHRSPKVWMHHLEISDPDQVDEEVARWLRDAYDAGS